MSGEPPSSPRLPAFTRKRSLVSPQSLRFNSSDPAVFSSDDDPGLDNYVEGRRKKRYVGSWFQQRLDAAESSVDNGAGRVSTVPPKRLLKRDLDSGIFLGSDTTDGEDFIEHLEAPAVPRLPQIAPRTVPRLSQPEIVARQKIQECIDRGNEMVDLWGVGLEELSDDIVNRLGQVTSIPVVAKDVAFVPPPPNLQVFLALNKLARLPGSLCDITNLTVLSLRSNGLTELPPAISKLTNLTGLNLSHNKLRYLPSEILELVKPGGKLRDLSITFNPLWRPQRPDSCTADDACEERGRRKHTSSWLSMHRDKRGYMVHWLGRSPLQVSNSNGRVLSEFRLPPMDEAPEPSEARVSVAVYIDEESGVPVSLSSQASAGLRKGEATPGSVPSLTELALRSCYRSSYLRDLDSLIPEGLSHLRKLVQRTSLQKDMGGLPCSTCGKTVVVPLLEWVEWRELLKCSSKDSEELPRARIFTVEELAVPFLYRACSWRCGPTDEKPE
ncbi:hypothetical protein HDV57DRAFT_464358 [Trichoderma longibrachiatum]|uniref:L domain-like protein n=1 Tax=Trichoderma longibrachiatum ATCC 18648 TaxID=983965 RepID=A0A2T4C5G3_TRILO|nr:hypothetical protein M440DRAFT_1421886 [Trichoderma longibrachiatum ATCC 18648]